MKYTHLVFFCFFSFASIANSCDSASVVLENDTLVCIEKLTIETVTNVADSSRIKANEKRMISFMSFPFPLGITGMHRIFMGAKPYVPFIYIATLGGCFGILPLIDFIILVTHKDIEPYRNDKVFMWLK
jgi:hypothetical protein